ncbi:hypothetical protein [Nocardia asteroides]|uniref:hypothetical protein n=1 Tax=Nocardia asteroides TaxID=1824 RepID=UPI001E42B3B6|nr:hypothetical protein [Nocardia asteroides]UGT53973.1 hypothetical protein LTT85_25420 [Nocardia asteroides]
MKHSDPLTDVERLVLELLAPGGLLTLDTMARRTGRRVRDVRRATASLLAKNLAWANHRGQWSTTPMSNARNSSDDYNRPSRNELAEHLAAMTAAGWITAAPGVPSADSTHARATPEARR